MTPTKTLKRQPSVTLVTMPFAELATPSVAVGILKSALNEDNIETETIEGQILFAERVGPSVYSSMKVSLTFLVGEWIFSKVAFPDFSPPDDVFLDRVTSSLPPETARQVSSNLKMIRSMATMFVHDVARRIVDSGTRVVACTSVFQQHCASIGLLRRVKKLSPSTITMIGGSNCESEMGKATLLNFDWIDVVVSGDADDLIAPLCRSLLTMGPDQPAEQLPEGVFAHDHRRRWRSGELLPVTRRVFRDMERSPVPDYDSYFDTLLSSPANLAVSPGLPIETSRGCWWGQKSHCTFCGIESGSMELRSKSADRVMAELVELVGRYRIPRIKTVDLIMDFKYFKDLLPRLREESRGYKIFYEVKANLSRERMKALREAGILWIQPGIESLDDKTLARIRKGSTAAINIQCLKWAREQGIWAIWSILTEVPGEQLKGYDETSKLAPLLTHLQPPMPWNSIAFHRFSPYHSAPSSFGLELVASWKYYYIYPLSVEAMQDLAYEFQDIRGINVLTDCPPPVEEHVGDQALPREVFELSEIISEWRRLFVSAAPPIMTLEDRGDRCRIHDTRPCALEETIELTGNAYRVYRSCESARSRAGILRELSSETITETELDEVLGSLVERRLLASIGDRFLALAIFGEPRALPDMREFPEGTVVSGYDDIVIARSGAKAGAAT